MAAALPRSRVDLHGLEGLRFDLVKAVLTTYCPSVEDQKWQTPAAVGESYDGTKCTGTVLMAPLAAVPPSNIAEGYAGLENVHPFIGNHLIMRVHMHLTQKTSLNVRRVETSRLFGVHAPMNGYGRLFAKPIHEVWTDWITAGYPCIQTSRSRHRAGRN